MRLCERDGDDGNARRVEALMIELREAFGDDADAFDGARRLVFALEGAGGDAAVRERRAMTVEGREGYSGLGARVVALEDETREARERSMRATPSVGGLRARDEKRETGDRRAVMRVPTLRLGAVFGARDEDASESEREGSEEDVSDSARDDGARNADRGAKGGEGEGDDDDATTSANAWLLAARDSTKTLVSWDDRGVGARDGESALGAAAFDAAYRSTFTSARGVDGETVIASERDCAHVVAAALAGCQTNADILIAAGNREGEVTMRFAAGSTTAFQNALKTMAEAAERRCELEHALDDICLLYTSPSPRDGLLSRMPSSA